MYALGPAGCFRRPPQLNEYFRHAQSGIDLKQGYPSTAFIVGYLPGKRLLLHQPHRLREKRAGQSLASMEYPFCVGPCSRIQRTTSKLTHFPLVLLPVYKRTNLARAFHISNI